MAKDEGSSAAWAYLQAHGLAFQLPFRSVAGVLLHSNFTTFTTGHFKKDATTAAVDLPKGKFYLFLLQRVS